MNRYISCLVVVLAVCHSDGKVRGEEAWPWKNNPLPRVLACQGIWNEAYRLPEALSEAGGADLHEALHFVYRRSKGLDLVTGSNQNPSLTAVEDWVEYDLLVLNNVPADAFSPQQMERVQAFVRQGGGLLLLGGYWTLDKGAMKGTVFEEILPVQIVNSGHRLAHAPDGLALQPQENHPVVQFINWSAQPSLFFYHLLIPRPESQVAVHAGEHPILVLGQYGRGRTAIFAGSVNGFSRNGVLPFWEWEDWPALLGQVIEWLWAPRRKMAMENPPPPPAKIQGLSDAEKENLAFAEGDEKVQWIREAVKRCDAGTAEVLFEELVGNEDLATDLQLEIMKAIQPHAPPKWAETLLKMNVPLDPAFQRQWLELVGATRSQEAFPVLLQHLESPHPDVLRAVLAGLAGLESPKAIPALSRYREKLGSLGLEKIEDGEEYLQALPDPTDMRVDALIALYRCGAPATPREMLDSYDGYLFYSEYLNALFTTGKWPDPKVDPAGYLMMKDMLYRLNFLRGQVRRIREALSPVPPSLAGEFVEAAVVEKRPHCLLPLYEAIRKSVNSENALSLAGLWRANDAGVARLGAAAAVEHGGEKASAAIHDGMQKEWQEVGPRRRRRLLRLALLLHPEHTRKMISLGKTDENETVRKIAESLTRDP